MNPTQTNNSFFTQKPFLIGGGIVILVALVIITMSSNNTSNPTSQNEPSQAPSGTQSKEYKDTSATANWKEYRYNGLGFLFKYPPQFFAHTLSSDAIFISTSSTPHDPDELAMGLQITVTEGDVIQTNFDQARELFDTPMVEDVVIDGVQGKSLSGYGRGMLAGKYIKFVDIIQRGKTVELSYFEGDPNFTQETFEQIIATFKFAK